MATRARALSQHALRAVAIGLIVLALLWNPHTVIPLYFLAFIITLITQFFIPAKALEWPMLVDKCDMVPALSLFNITLTVAQTLGFLVVGGLITLLFPPFHLSLGLASVQVHLETSPELIDEYLAQCLDQKQVFRLFNRPSRLINHYQNFILDPTIETGTCP
jgi:hypothetical protein